MTDHSGSIAPRRSRAPSPRLLSPEIVFAWILCALGAVALFVEAALDRPDGLRDAYRLAADEAIEDVHVIAALGTPIETRTIPSLDIETGPGYRHVELTMRLLGPRGEGVLRARLERNFGPWHIESMRLELEGEPVPLILR